MVVICMYFVRLIIVKNRFIFEVSCRNKVLIINLFDWKYFFNNSLMIFFWKNNIKFGVFFLVL